MVDSSVSSPIPWHAPETGSIVTEDNQEQMPAEALEEWEAAIREYQELTKGKPS